MSSKIYETVLMMLSIAALLCFLSGILFVLVPPYIEWAQSLPTEPWLSIGFFLIYNFILLVGVIIVLTTEFGNPWESK